MIKRVSTLTNLAVILAAALGLILSPTLGMASSAAIAKRHYTQVMPGRQTVHFQEQQHVSPDWDHDADGFYTPTRSPGWNDLIH